MGSNVGRDLIPVDWVMDGKELPCSPQESERHALANWASAMPLSEEDGWHPEFWREKSGRQYDGACRIDPRFHGRSAWAIRRLGGEELASRIVGAVVDACADKQTFVEGAILLVNGIVFRFNYYGWGDGEPHLVIYDAEVVAPHPSHPPGLTAFFVDLWETRARNAHAFADALTGNPMATFPLQHDVSAP